MMSKGHSRLFSMDDLDKYADLEDTQMQILFICYFLNE